MKKWHAIWLVHYKLLYRFPFHLPCQQNLFFHLLIIHMKIACSAFECLWMSCVRRNEEKSLWIWKKTKLKLAWEYSSSYLHAGPCLLGSTLKQLIPSFVMKYCKFCVQILHLTLHFLFIICVHKELLIILHNGLLKGHRIWEIKTTESANGWGWKGSLEVICYNPPAQSVRPRAGILIVRAGPYTCIS